MKVITDWLNDSRYIKPLSPACKMCADGAKMVLLITGLCPSNCFYCPLSLEKLNKDRIFADEWELDDEEDTEKLVNESEYINAKGAGITGGDPLIVWTRTKKYIKILKENFGSNFHIHLYTSGLKNYDKISKMSEIGLDEIRFHPMVNEWNNMDKSIIKKSIELSLNTNLDVAIEIPVIPNMQNETIKLIRWADKKNIDFVNLNELEFSETNAKKLNNKKYDVKTDISSAVKNSEKTAYDILNCLQKEDLDIGIHYCSSSFKDGIQLKNRIKRRAKNISKKYETITEDGTILKGIIVLKSNTKIDDLIKDLKEKYPEDMIFFNKNKNRIETSIEMVEEISKHKDLKCFITEEYPTADRLEVERIPL